MLRLQTVGALRAGPKATIVPGEAIIKLHLRTFDEAARAHAARAPLGA